jgi:hypothetical protein
MSGKEKNEKNENKKKKKWTLMFFFASDNNLSASMFYQLKAIKTAGFQVDTNVLAHFDPHERGMPSMIFEINRMERAGKKKSKIGDNKNPTIRDLAGDQVKPEIVEDECRSRSSSEFDDLPADQALTQFLAFCRENYPAEHYMLFLVGHGMIVGRDAFLPDDNPNSGISLVELGSILRDFSEEIREDKEYLELVAMHSCSMSAVEVAYQLKGTAKYMIASEGLSFVGAWPYRQMLQKIFCAIDYGSMNVQDLMKVIHEACLHNGADFIFAGYSSDLCLISLEEKRVKALNGPIERLTKALQEGLKTERGEDLIKLAHLKSQSFFQEVYTDLYDFCKCLREKCGESKTRVLAEMSLACKDVIDMLMSESDGPTDGPIVQADFAGPDCQYSYGLSIYFPWARPVEDASEHVIKNYRNYAFVTELAGASWLQFLTAYFKTTMRDPLPLKDALNDEETKTWNFAAAAYKPFGSSGGPTAFTSGALTGKDSPADAGGDFSFSVIKNYPREFAISKRALKVFANEKGRTNHTK